MGIYDTFVRREPVSKLVLKRKREEIMADKEMRGNRPEAQQRCVEDGFP